MPPKRPSRSTGRVTLADVANAADVSAITVSRALRGSPSVKPEVAARVAAAAQALGYVPDPAARALASQRSRVIAVLVPSLSNSVFVDLLEAVHEVMMPAGFDVLIGNTHYQREHEERLLQSYLAHRPAGVMVTGFDRTEAARRALTQSGVPAIHLMEISAAPGVYSVGLAQEMAGETVVQHLLERGRKRIAFVAAQLDPLTMQRAEGYRAALRRAGRYDAALELLHPERSSIGMGATLIRELLARHADVDAVFLCNDDLAQGALAELLRMGIRVPDQLAIVGFNDLAGAGHTVPRLTTIRTDRERIGREAALMLLKLIRGEAVAPAMVDVGYELVVRESSG
jgi:LacI family transcriptional regulator, gluconate utilization system Gnt-I transcriptional repressor